MKKAIRRWLSLIQVATGRLQFAVQILIMLKPQGIDDAEGTGQ